MRAFHFLAAIVIVTAATPFAEADLVTYSFSGEITSIPSGSGFAGIDLGSPFSGSFQYDTSLAGADYDSDPKGGGYPLVASPLNFVNITLAGWTFSGAPPEVHVADNSSTGDALRFSIADIGLPAGWTTTADGLVVLFQDSTKTAFSSDALPTSFDPSDFDSGIVQWRLTGVTFPGGSSPGALITGTIDLSAVPEPSSAVLALAAAGLGWVSSRLRSNRRRSLSPLHCLAGNAHQPIRRDEGL